MEEALTGPLICWVNVLDFCIKIANFLLLVLGLCLLCIWIEIFHIKLNKIDTGKKKKSDCQLFSEQDNVKKKVPFPTYLVGEYLGSHY